MSLSYENAVLERAGRAVFTGILYGGSAAEWVALPTTERSFYKCIAQDAIDAFLEGK